MLKKTFPVDNDWASSERMFVQEFELQFLLHRTVGPITRLFMCAEVANRRDDRPNVRAVSLTLSLLFSSFSLLHSLFLSLSLFLYVCVSTSKKEERRGRTRSWEEEQEEQEAAQRYNWICHPGRT